MTRWRNLFSLSHYNQEKVILVFCADTQGKIIQLMFCCSWLFLQTSQISTTKTPIRIFLVKCNSPKLVATEKDKCHAITLYKGGPHNTAIFNYAEILKQYHEGRSKHKAFSYPTASTEKPFWSLLEYYWCLLRVKVNAKQFENAAINFNVRPWVQLHGSAAILIRALHKTSPKQVWKLISLQITFQRAQ